MELLKLRRFFCGSVYFGRGSVDDATCHIRQP